jgi:Nucleotidyltransferase domain
MTRWNMPTRSRTHRRGRSAMPSPLILHGSLTLGDYLPGRSDIDLLLIVNDPLTDAPPLRVSPRRSASSGHEDRSVSTYG